MATIQDMMEVKDFLIENKQTGSTNSTLRRLRWWPLLYQMCGAKQLRGMTFDWVSHCISKSAISEVTRHYS